MRPDPQKFQIARKYWSLILLLCLFGVPLGAVSAGLTPVVIFGDGNPENGTEDDREQVLGGRRRGLSLGDQRMNAGTVKCDGKVRGTAMVLDTRGFAPDLKGVVLASAAHVFYNLDKKQRFKHCEFHFLALSELKRYRARIDLEEVKMGGFDPRSAIASPGFGEGDWAFLYVPRVWRGFNMDEALIPRDFSFTQSELYQQAGGAMNLVAFDSAVGVISVSRNCTVIESRSGDLGGGTWQGQLLDDCDSAGGASGGGIIAVAGDRRYLIAIRTGSHWSEDVFPANDFPLGPPKGSVWNRNTNTNFSRAIDGHILQELQSFTRLLERREKRY